MLVYKPNRTEGVYTLSDFMAACEKPAAREGNQKALDAHKSREEHAWLGLTEDKRAGETTHQTTCRLVRDGWQRGVDLMQKIASQITPPTPRAVRRVQRWQSQGDDVEMQRVWHGDLDHAWRGSSRDWRSGPQRIRLLIDAIESGGETAEKMRWKGVAALKLADALTEAGYSVQIESVIACPDSSDDKHKFVCRVIVKDYQQPVDLLTLAATSACPAFFRSLIHTWGLAVAQHSRHGVSYNVPRVTPIDDLADPSDDAPTFMLARSIVNAEKAAARITEIIGEIDARE